MPWTKIDDQFYDHPKVIAAGPLGVALFVCSLSYCARHLTDGFITATQAKRLIDVGDPLEVAAQLVAVGLWERRDGGYQVHDYLDYNPSAVQVKAQREKYVRKQQLYDDPFLTRRVKARDGNGCRYCGTEVKWHDRKSANGGTYDHVDPEGPNSEANLVVACRGCNSKKGRRTPEEAGMPLLPLNEESSSEPDNNQNNNQNNSTIPIPDPIPDPMPEPASEEPLSTAPAQAPAPTPPTPKPRRKSQKKPEPTEKQQASRSMFAALAEVCQIDLTVLTDAQRGALNQSERKLRSAGASPDDVGEFAEWWPICDWRGQRGQAPRPHQVRETWGQFVKWRDNGKPRPYTRNGKVSKPIERVPTPISLY